MKNEKLIMNNRGVGNAGGSSGYMSGDTVVAGTLDLESQIDELVFELYGLGEQEIGAIKS